MKFVSIVFRYAVRTKSKIISLKQVVKNIKERSISTGLKPFYKVVKNKTHFTPDPYFCKSGLA